MAPKLVVREYCPDCGARNAEVEDDVVAVGHECPKAPPGPADGIRWFSLTQVEFIPGGEDHALVLQLVADLNQAHDEICKLQGLDPEKHDWPEWTPQANTIREAEKRYKRKLAKTDKWTLYPSGGGRPVRPHRSGGSQVLPPLFEDKE